MLQLHVNPFTPPTIVVALRISPPSNSPPQSKVKKTLAMRPKKTISLLMNFPLKYPRIALINKHSGRCLDAPHGVSEDGVIIQQWDHNPDDQENQLWRIQHFSQEWWQIISLHTKKCLTQADWESGGGTLQLWPFAGEDNQLWRFAPLQNGFLSIVCKSNRKALEVKDWSSENGAPIQCHDYHEQENQLWKFFPADSPTPYIIYDTCFLRATNNPLRNLEYFSFINSRNETRYYQPTHILPLQVKQELEQARESKDEKSRIEVGRARGSMAEILGLERSGIVDTRKSPKWKLIETGGLGADSATDMGIINLALTLAQQPFAVVFIETIDGGIQLEAVQQFKKGHLIGCPKYAREFEKAIKSKMEPHPEIFHGGLLKMSPKVTTSICRSKPT